VQPAPQPPDRGDRAVVEQAKEHAADRGALKPAVANAPPAAKAPAAASAPAAVDAQAAAQKSGDRYWLQAGSFSTAPDAENLRARLALSGWEATVQEGALPDKSVRYRVRIGPYDNVDELGRIKSELAKRGFDVAVIHY
jgi:cell division protein FtsN